MPWYRLIMIKDVIMIMNGAVRSGSYNLPCVAGFHVDEYPITTIRSASGTGLPALFPVINLKTGARTNCFGIVTEVRPNVFDIKFSAVHNNSRNCDMGTTTIDLDDFNADPKWIDELKLMQTNCIKLFIPLRGRTAH